MNKFITLTVACFALFVQADAGDNKRYCENPTINSVPDTLDQEIWPEIENALDQSKKIDKKYTKDDTFLSELNALIKIQKCGGHINIAGLDEMYEDRRWYYLILELISGEDAYK